VNHLGESFTGRVIGDVLSGTMGGTQPFSLANPTSSDVLGCSGALASPRMSPADLALGAVVCAALSRGVATRPSALWYLPSAYYTAPPDNEYTGFFHTIAIGTALTASPTTTSTIRARSRSFPTPIPRRASQSPSAGEPEQSGTGVGDTPY